ncbi:MAG TPA: PEP-CTERM sorting domain-containing protein [Candidatus Paceibacterota bacterium]|nr:PEP-CTERM sorting domain-containing protein [Verrucomicrobiota bacterium]HSA11384.1 PEP-CTERM sorting domain-containing protein [Candidatus Paceibacterota bacterium]
MKNLIQAIAVLLLACATAQAEDILLISDNYDVTDSATGFGANSGVNKQIATRMTGSAATGLSYIQTATDKSAAAFSITGGKIAVKRSPNSGRFTLSADGTTAFNLASVLGTASATPAAPVIYEITMSMANTYQNTTRFSFALATVESNANVWDFGIQLYRADGADDFYQIGKRIDSGSRVGAQTPDAAGDINESIIATEAGTYGSELNFLMRVTDAGAESGANYHSQLQLSLDGGNSWFYDTAKDEDLPNGWRLDGAGRYLSWDQAGAGSGITAPTVTYDNFSVTIVPEPSSLALGLLAGAVGLIWRRR